MMCLDVFVAVDTNRSLLLRYQQVQGFVLSLYLHQPCSSISRERVEADCRETVRQKTHQLLIEMACEIPVRLPRRMDLLSQKLQDRGTLFHPDLSSLNLTAWKLSADPGRRLAFQRMLSKQPSLPSVTPPELSTRPGGPLTSVGAMDGILIPFLSL